jgi:heat shock protein HslJ
MNQRILHLLGVLVACCNPAVAVSNTPASDPTALEGTTWVLQAYGEAQNPTTALASTQISAAFNGKSGAVSGSAGCNQYFANYKADTDKLSVSGAGATKKLCAEPAGVMEQEQRFFELLQSMSRFTVRDGFLELTTANGARFLRFASSRALQGATWVLQAYGDGRNPTAVLAGTQITATFNGDAARISGSAGCNSYFAGYKADGGNLSTDAIGATKKFCAEPAGVMAQEQQYFQLLQSMSKYQIGQGILQLTTADGSQILRFTSAAALEGTTWVLQAYGEARNPTAVLTGTEITATFSGKGAPSGRQGAATGSAGCNHYFADYTADGGRFTTSGIGMTEKACAEPPGVMAQEQQYFQLLRSMTQYRVSGEALELTTADSQRLLRYVARK